MSEREITYEREMTMTYGEDRMTSHQRNRMNTLLYREGVCMVDDYAYRQNTDQARFGNEEIKRKKTVTNISVVGEGIGRMIQETDRDVIRGWQTALAALGFSRSELIQDSTTFSMEAILDDSLGDISVTFEKETSETTKTIEQSPQGTYLILAGANDYGDSGYGIPTECDSPDGRPDGYTLCVIGDEEESRYTFVRVELRLGAYNPPTLSFKMWYDADSIEKKDAIEQRLVNDPLPLMGSLQATVERCLKFLGVNTEDPVVDCEFKCLNESKSECAPDIIAMVRAEKQRHL